MTTALAFLTTPGPDSAYEPAGFVTSSGNEVWYLDTGAASIEEAVYAHLSPLLPNPVVGIPDNGETGIIVTGAARVDAYRDVYQVDVSVALPGEDMAALVVLAAEQQAAIEGLRMDQIGFYRLLRYMPAGHEADFDDDGRFVGLTHTYNLTYVEYAR